MYKTFKEVKKGTFFTKTDDRLSEVFEKTSSYTAKDKDGDYTQFGSFEIVYQECDSY